MDTNENSTDELATHPTFTSSHPTSPDIFLSPLPPSFKVVSSIPSLVVVPPEIKKKRKGDGSF